MSKLSGIELRCARLVPSAMFASPMEVARSAALSIAQKVAILRRWEFDMRRGDGDSVRSASSEMRMLEEVRLALATLGVVTSPHRQPRLGPAAHDL